MPTLATLLAGIEDLLGAAPRFRGCSPQTSVTDLAVDSRSVQPGAAFLTLRGHTQDGERFIADARQRGATVVLTREGATVDGVHVLLSDPDRAYPYVAANRYEWPGKRLQLAAVTGTNGKTTVAHLVAAILQQASRNHVRLGTTGNWLVDRESDSRFTTPFPLELQALLARAVAAEATHGVLEASSHALVQHRLVPLQFAAVGLTSFSQDHLDYHRDMQDYLAAKCSLARDHLARGGVAVAPDGPAAAAFLTAAASAGGQSWRASIHNDPSADLSVHDHRLGADGIEAQVRTPFGEIELRSPLLGSFNLSNLLVALGLGLGLGLDLGDIAAALAHARGAPGRLERVDANHDLVSAPTVLVDYAHTPDAVERILETMRPLCSGRLVVVLGCGGDRDATKRPLMGSTAATAADRFYATSDNPRSEEPATIIDQMLAGVPKSRRGQVEREDDRALAIERAILEAGPDDVVILAGKGHETYQVLSTGTIHFDDREHARNALSKRSPRS